MIPVMLDFVELYQLQVIKSTEKFSLKSVRTNFPHFTVYFQLSHGKKMQLIRLFSSELLCPDFSYDPVCFSGSVAQLSH